MTQEEFAKVLNVAISTVNRWEKGKAKPNSTTMKAIKAFCNEHNYPYERIEKEWLDYSEEE
jgi:DNA-binding transcriptional regulator YiaG